MKAQHLLFLAFTFSILGCISRPTKTGYSERVNHDIPELYARVNDYANILSEEEENDLNQLLKSLEDSIGSQLAILAIDSLPGQTIETYSLRVANEWGIGRAEYNDGILITLSIKNRKVRIAVGYGLELIIEDHIAKRIIDSVMIPEFKTQNFYSGLRKGSQEMINLIYSNPELVGKE